jgi:hypothetical protein
LAGLLLTALVLSLIIHRTVVPLLAAVFLTFCLVLIDVTRLQPWVYQYTIMLSLLACAKSRVVEKTSAEPILFAVQLLIGLLYFWSGAQKLNWSFANEILPALLTHTGLQLPSGAAWWLSAFGACVALCEAMIGVGLLIRRTRRVAVALAVSMHLLVLLIFVAGGHNSIVWPWNSAMMLMVLVSFRDRSSLWKGLIRPRADSIAGRLPLAVFFVCGVLPCLSFFGWWDLFLSGALYSGNTPVAVMRIDEQMRDALPVTAQREVFETSREELILPFHEWSLAELNVPPYPEPRVFRALSRRLCAIAPGRSEIKLIIKQRPSLLDGSFTVTITDCSELDR